MPNRRSVLSAGGALAASSLLPATAGAQPAPPGAGGEAPSLTEHTTFILPATADPLMLFATWLQSAKDDGEANYNAATLATVDRAGMPDARMMLLREVHDGAFLFTSFANSAKGKQLQANPRAAMVFYWDKSGRMVRVRGNVTPADPALNAAMFATRSGRKTRLKDLAWPQSQEIRSSEELEERLRAMDKAYPEAVPRRDWTGYLLTPLSIEFFQPHPGTFLHERLRFTRASASAAWKAARLAP